MNNVNSTDFPFVEASFSLDASVASWLIVYWRRDISW